LPLLAAVQSGLGGWPKPTVSGIAKCTDACIIMLLVLRPSNVSHWQQPHNRSSPNRAKPSHTTSDLSAASPHAQHAVKMMPRDQPSQSGRSKRLGGGHGHHSDPTEQPNPYGRPPLPRPPCRWSAPAPCCAPCKHSRRAWRVWRPPRRHLGRRERLAKVDEKTTRRSTAPSLMEGEQRR